MHGPPFDREMVYLLRFIPVGTTIETFNRPPDFCFNGKLKPGHTLPLDSPVLTRNLTFKPLP